MATMHTFLEGKKDWVNAVQLEPDEIDGLKRVAASLKESERFVPYTKEPFLDPVIARGILRALRPETLLAIEDYIQGASSVLLLRGLPVTENLGPTPECETKQGLHRNAILSKMGGKAQKNYLHEAVMLAVGSLLGERFGGFDHVYPTSQNRMEIHNQSSGIGLGWHTDFSKRSFGPKYNMLCIARAGEQPDSLFARANDVWEQLDAADQKLLTGNHYTIPGHNTGYFPILTRDGDRVRFRLSPEAHSPDATAARALRRLNSLLSHAKNHVAFKTETGDLILYEGQELAHARGRFTMHENPEQRRYVLGLTRSDQTPRPAGPQMLY